jgi:hypothetical protein
MLRRWECRLSTENLNTASTHTGTIGRVLMMSTRHRTVQPVPSRLMAYLTWQVAQSQPGLTLAYLVFLQVGPCQSPRGTPCQLSKVQAPSPARRFPQHSRRSGNLFIWFLRTVCRGFALSVCDG